MADSRILVTSALPYVNNIVHLGNIIGCVLSADTFARFCRLMKKDVLYVGGTDEYGTATETSAREKGLTPKELCDMNFEVHKKVYDWFNISFDCFGRTSTDDPSNERWAQTELTWNIYKKLVENDLIESKKETCLYCKEINSFVSDRYVTGTCYLCGYEKANGDQCDNCTKLLEAKKLIDPVYKLNPSYKLVEKETEHLYFKIPQLHDRLVDLLKHSSNKWSHNATAITETLLEQGLVDRSITRDLKWGTPVPDTEKFGDRFKNKVFYVWFDAPIGYLSITKTALGEDYKKWWMSDNVELVQFMAKDNVQFHSIIFPATLMGTGEKYNIVSRISSTEYLQYGNKKFSKTNKTGVFGDDVMNLPFPSDYWRFYLLSIRPENKDSKFSWEGFASCINDNLFATFGNLVSRVLNMSFKGCKKLNITTVTLSGLNSEQQECNENINLYVKEYIEAFENIKIVHSIRKAQESAFLLNEYISKTEPWKKLSESELGFLLFELNKIVNIYSPYIPTVCDTVRKLINGNNDILEEYSVSEHKFSLQTEKPQQLFKLIDYESLSQYKERFGSTE